MDAELSGVGKRGLPKLREILRRPRGESEVSYLFFTSWNVSDSFPHDSLDQEAFYAHKGGKKWQRS